MSYEMAQHPEWEFEEFREKLRYELLAILDPDDRARLKALDVAAYIPTNISVAMALDRSGIPDGGAVQIAGYVCRRGDADSGAAFRVMVPRLLKWSDIALVARELATPIAKSLGKLDWEDRAVQDVRTGISMPMANELPA